MDVGLLDHGRQGFLRYAARLEEAWEVAALPQFWDMPFDRAGPGLPAVLAIAVALVGPVGLRTPGGAPVRASTSMSISRWAVKPIISRRKSASVVFSSRSWRFMDSAVILGSLVGVDVRNQTCPKIRDEHRYG